MVIEPTNSASGNLPSRPEKEVTPDAVKQSNVGNEGIPQTGQTSEIAPAVVPNISASTLETSRAVNAPDQTSEKPKSDNIVDAREKDLLPKIESNSSNGTNPQLQSTIDTTI